MRIHVGLGLSVAALAGGCVHGDGRSATGQSSVSAHIQLAVSQPPRLAAVPDVPSVPGARVTAETIQATLDPHGRWVNDPVYGTIWIPAAEETGSGFVPYGSNGQWVMTDAGWYWQSGYSWGWLTFHYGRWVQISEVWA